MPSGRRRKMRISILIKEWSHLISQSLGREKTGMTSTRGEEQEKIIMGDWSWLHLGYSSDLIISWKETDWMTVWLNWFILVSVSQLKVVDECSHQMTYQSHIDRFDRIWVQLSDEWVDQMTESIQRKKKDWYEFNLMLSDLSWIISEWIEWNSFDLWDFYFIFSSKFECNIINEIDLFGDRIWFILFGNIRIILSHFSVYFVHFSLYLFPQINNIILVYCSKGCYLSVEFVLKGIWRHFHPSFYQCHFRLFLMVMVKIGWICQLIV